jgi:LysM repeat protein
VLAACVAVQQVEADDVTAAPGIQLVSGHGHHHKAHHGKHHRHHHAHHRAHHRAGGHHPGRRMVHYTVRPGDTATELAVRFHAWTDELLAVNHLGPHEVIYVGETLTIPVVRSAARRAARHRHHYAATHHHAKHGHHGAHHKHGHKHGHHGHKHGDEHHHPYARHHRHHHENHHSAHHRHHAKHHGNHHRHHRVHLPNPDRATVRRVIIKTSHRYGVGSNLALAISWQESGWQMDQISSAHALGAMQVLPSTGRWLSTVVGRRLELRDLHDNVTAGVVLIRVLREQASVRHSVAGYYQGLASVRADGMYRDTKHYVSNVLYLRKLLRHGWNPA